MRLKMDEVEGIKVLSIRGKIEQKHLRMLLIGIESMYKNPVQNLVFNFGRAEFGPTEAATISAYKKAKASSDFKGKISWISKEKSIGDFINSDIFFSRLTGSKFRLIAEKVKLDDHIDELFSQKTILEDKLKSMVGDDESTHMAALIENQNLKIKKKILKEQNQSHQKRQSEMTAIPTTQEDFEMSVATAISNLKESLQKSGFIGIGEESKEL